MSVKEKPLMNAVSRSGPLPMPENPFWAGFCAVLAMAFMGGFVTIFASFTYGASRPLPMYEMARAGAAVALILAALLALVTLATASQDSDEKAFKRQFCTGVAVAIIILLFVDFLAVDWLREEFGGMRPGQSQWGGI